MVRGGGPVVVVLVVPLFSWCGPVRGGGVVAVVRGGWSRSCGPVARGGGPVARGGGPVVVVRGGGPVPEWWFRGGGPWRWSRSGGPVAAVVVVLWCPRWWSVVVVRGGGPWWWSGGGPWRWSVAVVQMVVRGGGPWWWSRWWSRGVCPVVFVPWCLSRGPAVVVRGGGPVAWWSRGGGPVAVVQWRWSVVVVRGGGPSARHRRFVYIAFYLRYR